MRRILIGGVVVLVVSVALPAMYVNEIAGSAVERAGSLVLGVETRVGFVRLRLRDLSFRLNGLAVRNPSGFDRPEFLTLRDGSLSVDRGTLFDELVVVPELRLSGIDVALERDGKKTNYGVILRNMKQFEKEHAAGGEPAEPPEADSEKRFVVKQLVIENVTALVEWSEIASDATGLNVVIPRIELADVGAEGGRGVSLAELGDIVMKAVLGSVARYGGDLPAAMLQGLNGGLGSLSRLSGVSVSGLGGSLTEATGKIVGGSGVKDVGRAVGSSASKAMGRLFGSKDEE